MLLVSYIFLLVGLLVTLVTYFHTRVHLFMHIVGLQFTNTHKEEEGATFYFFKETLRMEQCFYVFKYG